MGQKHDAIVRTRSEPARSRSRHEDARTRNLTTSTIKIVAHNEATSLNWDGS